MPASDGGAPANDGGPPVAICPVGSDPTQPEILHAFNTGAFSFFPPWSTFSAGTIHFTSPKKTGARLGPLVSEIICYSPATGALAWGPPIGDGEVLGLGPTASTWVAVTERGGAMNDPRTATLWRSDGTSVEIYRDDGVSDLNAVRALATDPITGTAYLAREQTVDAMTLSTGKLSTLATVKDGAAIAVTTSSVLVATSALLAIDRATGLSTQLAVAFDGLTPVFGHDGDTVFVFGRSLAAPASGLGTGALMAVSPPNTVTPILEPSATVVSIAADATHVYWSDTPADTGPTIRRTPRTPNTGKSDVGQQLLVGTAGEKFDRLLVRGDCLYYWTVTQKGASLRARPKSKVD